MIRGRARRDHRQARPLEAVHDRKISRDHVNDRAGDEERRDLARAAFDHGPMGFLDHRQPAHSRTDIQADALGVLRIGLDPRVAERFHGSGNSVMNENIHAPRFFRRHHLSDVEVFHLAGDLGRERAGVEPGDASDPGLARLDIGPRLLDAVADRANDPQAGDYDSAPRQRDSRKRRE